MEVSFPRKKMKVVVADSNVKRMLYTANTFSEDEEIEFCKTAADGEVLISLVDEVMPDIIVMDLVLEKMDGISAMEKIRSSYQGCSQPVFILVCGAINDEILHIANQMGVVYYILRPCNVKIVVARAKQILRASEERHMYRLLETPGKIQSRTECCLREVGIPTNTKGYIYLRKAISMLYKNSDYFNGVTKMLYPEIAEKYNTSASCVERSIRHAIEVAWKNRKIMEGYSMINAGPDFLGENNIGEGTGNLNEFADKFIYSNRECRPTNLEFLNGAVEYIKNRLDEEKAINSLNILKPDLISARI